jgi:hypothetical protein
MQDKEILDNFKLGYFNNCHQSWQPDGTVIYQLYRTGDEDIYIVHYDPINDKVIKTKTEKSISVKKMLATDAPLHHRDKI